MVPTDNLDDRLTGPCGAAFNSAVSREPRERFARRVVREREDKSVDRFYRVEQASGVVGHTNKAEENQPVDWLHRPQLLVAPKFRFDRADTWH